MNVFKNKYSRLSILSLMTGSAVLVGSCTADFDEINTSKTAITVLSPAELPFLFARAQQQGSYAAGTYQTAQNLFADLFAQYFATTTPNFQSDRYFMHPTWINSHWNPIYTQVVPQLKSLFQNTDPSSPEYALADIWWVFSFHRLTDYYGPIPYFDAGEPANTVKYDSQESVYDDFFKRLASAAAVLKSNAAAKPYASHDVIYDGDAAKWLKFCNTLRLRLALRISKADPARAKTEAEAAIADGVMTEREDNAVMMKNLTGGDYNGLATISGWGEFRMSASMESYLKGYDDPRIGIYFQPAFSTQTYEGLRNGLDATQLAITKNTNDATSNVGTRWIVNTGAGSAWDRQLAADQEIMFTAEAYFLRAEAALNGWQAGGTAKELYENGIRASMAYWGVSDGAADAYIAGTKAPVAPEDGMNSPAVATIPVSWGATEAIQREQIATQKWLAVYPDGLEAWAEVRRTGWPKLYDVLNSVNNDLPTTARPRRIPFLSAEYTNNAPAMENAVKLLGGPDKPNTPLWWDKN